MFFYSVKKVNKIDDDVLVYLTSQHHAEQTPLFSADLRLSDSHSSTRVAEKKVQAISLNIKDHC